MRKKRFIVVRHCEVYYEVVDNVTNELVERFSTDDGVRYGSLMLYTPASEARRKAYALAKKLNKKSSKAMVE